MIKMKNNSNHIHVNTYFQEVFTNAGIGIITLDAKSSIEYINEEALNIFGYNTPRWLIQISLHLFIALIRNI